LLMNFLHSLDSVDKSYDHRRTHAARTRSGHAGSGVAFDHSLSPLYGMTVLQLKQLLLSLRTKVEGKFTVIYTSLIVGLHTQRVGWDVLS